MNQKLFKDTKWEPWIAAGLVILVTALTYGVLIPKLGFYRDDWYMLWAGQSDSGLSTIVKLFQTDRPLIGWMYALDFKLIGANVLYWQIYALLLKIITGLAVLWMLRLVWPDKRLETTLAALLFVLYPGFYQQPVAATFTIDLLGLNAAFISIALTIYALKTPNQLLKGLATLVALVLGLIYLGFYEASIGLEVIRWLLVWYVLWQENSTTTEASPISAAQPWFKPWIWNKATAIRALKILSPYLLMNFAFLYWRLFIFKSVRRATNINVVLSDYFSDPLHSLPQLFITYLKDLFETIIAAWFVPFYQFTSEGRYADFISGMGVTLVVLGLVAAYLFWFRRRNTEPETPDPIFRHFLLIGFISIAIPTAIINLLGRHVLFGIQWDRYTTLSMLGMGLLVVGFIFYTLRGSTRWAVLFSLLFLAVMTHYHSAAYHVRFWNYERSIVWQLSWRAPGLQPGTTLVVSLPDGYRLAEEYEVWGPANMVYYPGQAAQLSGQIPFDGIHLVLAEGKTEYRVMRNIDVERDYGKPLVISLPSANSCVHVIDGRQPFLPLLENDQIVQAARYSNIDLINVAASPVQPSAKTFGPEPARTWCYYYQKIQLALQGSDWKQAANLADEAVDKGLNPADLTEWMPVLEAYANSGQDKKASQIAKRIKSDATVRDLLCLQMAGFASWPAGYDPEKIMVPLCGSGQQ